jgi:uncharacterized SAM-binding protein YcdF (DUF218 family)
MFFVLSKLFWFVAEPGNFLVLLLALGLALYTQRRHRRLGLGIVGAVAGFLLLILAFPLGSWLVEPLEDRFSHPVWPSHVDGILVLGGGAVPEIMAERGMPLSLTGSARVLAGTEAARHYPDAKLVFSGGSGQLTKSAGTEADVAKIIFRPGGHRSWRHHIRKPVSKHMGEYCPQSGIGRSEIRRVMVAHNIGISYAAGDWGGAENGMEDDTLAVRLFDREELQRVGIPIELFIQPDSVGTGSA